MERFPGRLGPMGVTGMGLGRGREERGPECEESHRPSPPPTSPMPPARRTEGQAAVQADRHGATREDRRRGHVLEAGSEWRRHGPTVPTPLWPPSWVSPVWALTVRSQGSPRDGHRTGSGNVPRAACEEWDTQRVSALPRGSAVGEMENPPCPAPLELTDSQAHNQAQMQHPPALTHLSLRDALCKPQASSGGQ